MNFRIVPIAREDAGIIAEWAYPPPYDFYNMNTEVGIERELMDGSYAAVYQNQQLAGYVCFGENARIPSGEKQGLYEGSGIIDIGFGMDPELTGQGKGREFLRSILDYTEKTYRPAVIRLTVAAFNKRALKVYKSCGFINVMVLETEAEQNNTTYIIMERMVSEVQ